MYTYNHCSFNHLCFNQTTISYLYDQAEASALKNRMWKILKKGPLNGLT